MQAARHVALQLYRLAILAAIAWVIHQHHVRLRIEGNAPIVLSELTGFFPGAASLVPDAGERRGMWVHDAQGHTLGYVVRTSPFTDSIVGYRGWTDTLIAFTPALRVVGVSIRSSRDTHDHVGDVKGDQYFMKTWDGKSWDEVAGTTPEEAGIEGVSGATLTSMAVADAITQRLAAAQQAMAIKQPPLRLRWEDIGLTVIVVAAIVLAFTGTHGRPWLRRSFQVLVIGYVGFATGLLLAQSLFAGWAQSGVPWRTAPGLVLLMAAALAVPWATGKPLYCQQLCPHGAAQELIHRAAPKKWRLRLPAGLDAGLRRLPFAFLALVITVSILLLPIDLAHIEPFDAYVIQSAGWATIAIAVIGLIASAFVPMAYCHYGCPTGALLNFIRSHRRADGFSMRDIAAAVLLLLAAGLSWKYHEIHALMLGGI